MNNLWKDTFRKTLEYLKSASIPLGEWSFGGGTALMLYYHHRTSKDIDIFLAPFLTNSPIREYGYKHQRIRVESPVEIITNKIFYRSDTFQSRDLYDFGVVLNNREDRKSTRLHSIHRIRDRMPSSA